MECILPGLSIFFLFSGIGMILGLLWGTYRGAQLLWPEVRTLGRAVFVLLLALLALPLAALLGAMEYYRRDR